MPELASIPPVFIKDSDLPSRFREFSLCSLIASKISPDDLLGCQKIGDLWRIYITKDCAKETLLNERITVENTVIPVYKLNPFRTGANSPDDPVIKITIKDLPLSAHSQTLEHFLQSKGVTLARDIEYGKARDPQTHQLSNWYNGDRIAFAREMKQAIPRFVQIGSFTCRIFYDGQEQKPMLCTNCFQTDHTRGRCSKPPSCKACKKAGHLPGDKSCEAFLQKGHQRVTIVTEKTDPLSMDYECSLNVLGMNFNSVQQAYQYSKAIRRGQPDLATSIAEAPTPAIAKSKAKFLKFDPEWVKSEKRAVMADLLEAKADQVDEFKESLLSSNRSSIVDIDPGEYEWASGLNHEQTLHTKKKYWPGSNLLGIMLEELRVKLQTLEDPDIANQRRPSSQNGPH